MKCHYIFLFFILLSLLFQQVQSQSICEGIQIDAPSTFRISKGTYFTVSAYIVLEECPLLLENIESTNGSESVLWVWESIDLPNFVPVRSRILRLDTANFVAKNSYLFSITATGSRSGVEYGSKVITVEVHPTQFYPVIIGGSRRVNRDDIFELDASESFNPDNVNVRYRWHCVNAESNASCGIELDQTSILSLRASTFATGTYEFTVSMEPATDDSYKTETTSVTIEIMDAEIPNFFVHTQPMGIALVDTNQRLTVTVKSATPIFEPVTINWSLYENDNKLNIDKFIVPGTSKNDKDIVFEEEKLTPDRTYSIMSTIELKTGDVAYSTINLKTIRNPQITCTINSKSGEILQTLFNVECTSDDSLEYTLFLRSEQGDLTIEKNKLGQFAFLIPPTSNTKNHKVRIAIEAESGYRVKSNVVDFELNMNYGDNTDYNELLFNSLSSVPALFRQKHFSKLVTSLSFTDLLLNYRGNGLTKEQKKQLREDIAYTIFFASVEEGIREDELLSEAMHILVKPISELTFNVTDVVIQLAQRIVQDIDIGIDYGQSVVMNRLVENVAYAMGYLLEYLDERDKEINYQHNQDEKIDNEEIDGEGDIGSDIIILRNQVRNIITFGSLARLNSMVVNENRKLFITPTLDVYIKKVDISKIDNLEINFDNDRSTARLPSDVSENFKGDISIICSLYKYPPLKPQNIISKTISLGYYDNDEEEYQITKPGEIVFTLQSSSTSGSCVHFDNNDGKWKTEGCKVVKAEHKIITCACNDITGYFAISSGGDDENVAVNASVVIMIIIIIIALISLGGICVAAALMYRKRMTYNTEPNSHESIELTEEEVDE